MVPKVSILIPTFNRLSYLKDALDTARAQTLADIEIIVSDDGSTDGTADFLREQTQQDPRVRIAPRNPCRGLFENVNHLIATVKGQSFCVLGDDDRLRPAFAARLSSVLDREPGAVVAFCDHDIIDSEGRLLPTESLENSRRYGRATLASGIVARPELTAIRMSMCMGFSLYRTAAFGQERFDLSCGGAADADMALRAARKGGLYFVAEVLGSYRTHAQTATRTRRLFMSEGVIAALSRHRLRDAEAEALRREILQGSRLRVLPHLAMVNRPRMASLLLDYLREGGNPVKARIAIAGALAALPHAAASWLWSRATRNRSAA